MNTQKPFRKLNFQGISRNKQLIDPPFPKKAIVVLMAGLFAAPPVALGAEIEEIVVTATRRAENVQDVGMSITALDEQALKRAGITNVSRLQFGVAGLIYADAGKDAKMALRGVNSSNTFEDNPSVIGMYVDGVYKPNASMQTRAFFDVERLEFLKGPQGTLYGRNTFAGALNLYTNKPDFDGFSGSISTSFDRFSTLRTEGAVNVPVSDTFALRVAGFYENGDGYIDNNAGEDLGAPDDYGIRLSALWTPTDDLEIIARLSYVEEQGIAAAAFGWKLLCRRVNEDGFTDALGTVRDCQNSERGTVGGGGGGADGDEWDVSQDYTKVGDTWEKNVTVEINWDAGPVTIKSISSYTDMQNEIYQDFDYSSNPISPGGNNDYTESFTQEFVVASTGDGPLQWTAGGYYSDDESNSRFWAINAVARDARAECADGSVYGLAPKGGVCEDLGLTELINGTAITSTVTDISNSFGSENPVDTTARAVFGEVQFSVMDNLRLIAGGRYSETEKEGKGGGSSFTAGSGVTLRTPGEVVDIPNSAEEAFIYGNGPASGFTDITFYNTSARGGFEFDFGDDMMFYGTYSEGFLAGAVNIFGGATEDQESELFEIGLKSMWLDGTLRANVAIYTTEYTGLITQVQTIVQDEFGETSVRTDSTNGGEVDADGIDIELFYIPTDALSLGLNIAFLDAEFGEFGQTSPYQLNGGVPTEFESLKGETPGWSPDVVFNFTADYRFDLGARGSLTPMLSIHYSDDYNTSNLYSQDPAHKQDSYTKTDFRLNWLSADNKFTVAAYVENIEDEAVLSRGNSNSSDTVQVGYLYPRNYGISFSMNFD